MAANCGPSIDAVCHTPAVTGGSRTGAACQPASAAVTETAKVLENASSNLPARPGPPWLDDEEIALIERWIRQRAPDAGGKPAPMLVGGCDIAERGSLCRRRRERAENARIVKKKISDCASAAPAM